MPLPILIIPPPVTTAPLTMSSRLPAPAVREQRAGIGDGAGHDDMATAQRLDRRAHSDRAAAQRQGLVDARGSDHDPLTILAPLMPSLVLFLSVMMTALTPEVFSIPPRIMKSKRTTWALPPEATTHNPEVLEIIVLKQIEPA